MTLTFPCNFDAYTFSDTIARSATFAPGIDVPIRFSKPAAAASGGLLLYDAWASTGRDEPEVDPPLGWLAEVAIYGSKSGGPWEQLFQFGNIATTSYATKALAFAAVSAGFPLTFSGYDLYQIRLPQDGGVGGDGSHDNQGGMSFLVEYLDGINYQQILYHQPDAPIKEEWKWQSDVQTSYNGTEDRIPINNYAKRTFSGNYSFDTVKDIQKFMAVLQKASRKLFRVPLFQYQVKAKQPIPAAANEIYCNPQRGDFREGCEALIREGDTFELVVIQSMLDDRLVLGSTPLNSYSQRALVCPVSKVFTASGTQVHRTNLDTSGTIDYTWREYAPWLPFVNPFEEETLGTFDGMFVLDNRAIGTQFDQQFVSGLIITDDYIGKPDLYNPWTQGQWAFALRWQCNRVFDLHSWFWWQRFCDAIQGSNLAWLLPTFREDLPITTPAAGGGNVITFTGHEFRDHYYGLDTFARLVIESPVGRQFVKVTGLTNVGGNDRVTFAPALPAGAWSTDQKVGFLLKVRNVDDKVTVDHYGLHSDVSMSVTTVK